MSRAFEGQIKNTLKYLFLLKRIFVVKYKKVEMILNSAKLPIRVWRELKKVRRDDVL